MTPQVSLADETLGAQGTAEGLVVGLDHIRNSCKYQIA